MTSLGRLVVELHSVNKRVLDINVLLPRNYLLFDLPLREWVREKNSRGQVTVRVHLEFEDGVGAPLEKTTQDLKQLKEHWDTIAANLGYDSGKEVTLSFLLKQAPAGSKESLEERDLKEAFTNASIAFTKMKEQEGIALVADIEQRLQELHGLLSQIESLAPEAAKRYVARLKEKIDEVATPELEDRLYREMVLYADKIDITEEIVRLKSHFTQFEKYLKSQERSIGRTLDFLCQETFREINTIASKSQESEIATLAVGMKSELDKIKEQVQNIE